MERDDVVTTTHVIAVEALDRLAAIVDQHNRKVAKLGKRGYAVAPVTWRKLRIFQVAAPEWLGYSDDEEGPGRHTRAGEWMAEISIAGQAARVSGWDFVASLVLTEEGYLAAKTTAAALEIDLEAIKARGGECDHCRAVRRRSSTYVLRSRSEEVKLVGSSCLHDFAGSSDIPVTAMAAYADYQAGLVREIGELEEEGRSGGGFGSRHGSRKAIGLHEYLGFVRRMVRIKKEFVSAKRAEQHGGYPTRHHVATDMETLSQLEANLAAWLSPEGEGRCWTHFATSRLGAGYDPIKAHDDVELKVAWEAYKENSIAAIRSTIAELSPTASDAAAASADVELCEEVLGTKADLDDYESNVLSCLRQGYAFGRNMGLCASIVGLADRIRRDRAKEELRRTEKDEHFGTVGKREVFTLRCVYTQILDGAYGTTVLHILVDPEGRKAKWFCSGTLNALEKGATYELKATVKKHDLYQGRKTTVLNRCKVERKVKVAA